MYIPERHVTTVGDTRRRAMMLARQMAHPTKSFSWPVLRPRSTELTQTLEASTQIMLHVLALMVH